MAKQPTLSGLTPDLLAGVLSKAFGSEVSPQMIAADVEAGAPVTADGSINLVQYVAWMIAQDIDGRTA